MKHLGRWSRQFRMSRAIGPLAIGLAAILASPSASAHGRIGFGFGFGFPFFGPGYYGPPPYYPPVYSPPPAYYAPPEYAPPPPYYVPPSGPAPYSSSYNTDHCREYTATETIGGRPQTLVGTACLQPDGTWRIVQ
jgi:hypothetical protein